MADSLSHIRIVLSHPSHPGNIGSAARAMKNMGFSRLVLVNPAAFPHDKAVELAAGADDILANAVVVSSLSEAIAGCRLVMGTSARQREVPLPLIDPRQAAEKIGSFPSETEIALVFGRERTGLLNEELIACQAQILIPANPVYCSLNLAQAVQLICYECRYHLVQDEMVPMVQNPLATREAVLHFHEHLERVLGIMDFYHPTRSKRLLPRLKRLFSRIELEQMEVDILRGILRAIENKCSE